MSGDSQQQEGRNAYLDLLRGGLPEEIVRFGIESDPSTNVLGTATRAAGRGHLRLVTDDEIPDQPSGWRRHPVLTVISLVLIVVWIVIPGGLIILAHTGTWP